MGVRHGVGVVATASCRQKLLEQLYSGERQASAVDIARSFVPERFGSYGDFTSTVHTFRGQKGKRDMIRMGNGVRPLPVMRART